MNVNITFNWKTVTAIGASTVCIIFASKIDALTAEKVLTNIVEASKAFAVVK